MDRPDIHRKGDVGGRKFVIQQKDKEIDRDIDAETGNYPEIGLVDDHLLVFLHLVEIILETVEHQEAGFQGHQAAAEVIIVEKMLRQAEIQDDKKAEQPGNEPFEPDEKGLVQADKEEGEKVEPDQRVDIVQVVVRIERRRDMCPAFPDEVDQKVDDERRPDI
jgi:hypothetical protein